VFRHTCVMLACAVTTAASAQTTTPPPTPPTTTSTSAPRREPPDTMTLTLALAGAGAGDSEGFAPEVAALTGVHTDSDAMLAYQHRGRKAMFGLSGRGVLRYDAQAGSVTPMREQGTAAFSIGGLRASQSIGYSPYFQFGALPNAAPTPLDESALAHGDFANSDLGALTYTTDAAMTQAIGRRSTLSMSFNSQRTMFGESQSNLDQMSMIGSASLSHRLSRHLSLRTGYGLRSARYPTSGLETLRVHAIDLGLDYSRALSLTRRTSLSFSSGSVITKLADGMAYVVTGDATLVRMIGRTWNARVAVKRDVHLLDGFTEPVLANTFSTSVGGGLSRRMSMSTSVGVSQGTVGVVNESNNNYWNWTAGAGWRLAVGRRASLDAQYFYYGHRFDEGVVLAPGLAYQQLRQGLRVGMTWLFPVLP
jgi:hypothetical protein